MSGSFIINGTGSHEYGCTLREGAARALLCWPSLKNYDYNDWYEIDGIDADLSAPVLAARQFDLPLYFNSTDGYIAFYNSLMTKAYHTVEVPELAYSKRLRFVSATPPTMAQGMILVSMRFSDDFPIRTAGEGNENYGAFIYTAPMGDALTDGLWALDGNNFILYGVRVLEGTSSSGWQMPAFKENLSRDIQTLSGMIYEEYIDLDTAKEKAFDLTLKCMMSYNSAEDFMNVWNALLYDLIRPGARTVTGDLMIGDGAVKAVYKSSSVNEVSVSGGIHVKFSITLTALVNTED